MANRTGWPYLILAVALIVGAVALRVADPFFVRALRFVAFDTYQRLSPEIYDPSLPVRVVDIDEESLNRIGQWPWPRTVVAELLARLTQAGAAVVVFDVLFAEADQTSPEQMAGASASGDVELSELDVRQNDLVFAEAITSANVVLATALSNRQSPPPPPKAGFAVAGDDPRAFIPAFVGATRNLAILDDVTDGIGSINWIPDRDQIIRRVPLIFRMDETFVPSLTTEALRVAQGATTYILKASNASGETSFGEQTGLNHIRVGDFEIPTDADGGIWVKFRPSNPTAYIPAWQVLAGDSVGDEVEGRIVLVGTSAPGLSDLRATPLDPSISGVEVHAQAIEHILAGRSITRPDYSLAVELAVLVVLGVALAAVLPAISATQSALLGIAAIAAVFAAGWFAYSDAGLLFDPSFPALALLIFVSSATFLVYRRVELQRAEVRRAFGLYVSPSVVDELIAHPERLELGGEVRDLTLMFSDVRNFTTISERMNATELTGFINSLLTPLTDVILEKRGTIDKYMGDAIMAFWNAPLDDPDHAANACQAAVEMLVRVGELNQRWREESEAAGRPFVPVVIGIGINSGECLVGNLGSDQRFDYSALGDEVNVASRLEGLSKMYGIAVVIGESIVARLPDLGTLELDLLQVRGRMQVTRVYTLLETLGAGNAALSRLQPLHREMLEAVRAQAWDRAEGLIADCRNVGVETLKIYYDIYAARIAACRADPPPSDWDGSFSAETK